MDASLVETNLAFCSKLQGVPLHAIVENDMGIL